MSLNSVPHVSGYNGLAVFALGIVTGFVLVILFDVAGDMMARRKARRK